MNQADATRQLRVSLSPDLNVLARRDAVADVEVDEIGWEIHGRRQAVHDFHAVEAYLRR